MLKTFVLVLGFGAIGFSQGATNTRVLDQACSAAMPAAIRVLVEKDFRPVLVDKDTGLATFSYAGAAIIPRAFDKKIGAFGNQQQAVFLDGYIKNWRDLNFVGYKPNPKTDVTMRANAVSQIRFESVTVLAAPVETKCAVTIKITYGVQSLVTARWYAAESNHAFEESILAMIQTPTAQ